MTFDAIAARYPRCSFHYRCTFNPVFGLAFALLLALACKHARAASPDLPNVTAAPGAMVTPASEAQRRRTQEESEARQRRLQKSRVELPSPASNSSDSPDASGASTPPADSAQAADVTPDRLGSKDAAPDSLALPVEAGATRRISTLAFQQHS